MERSVELPGNRPPAPMKGRTFLLERKGVTQTTVVMMVAGNYPDRSRLSGVAKLADKVFGGGFFSRLYHIRLDREQPTKPARTSRPCPNTASAANSPVQADKTREAMAVFTKELVGMAGERRSRRAEFDAAKQHVIRAWPEAAVEQLDRGCDRRELGARQILERSRDFQQRIAAVTLDHNGGGNAARKYAQPDKAVFCWWETPTRSELSNTAWLP